MNTDSITINPEVEALVLKAVAGHDGVSFKRIADFVDYFNRLPVKDHELKMVLDELKKSAKVKLSDELWYKNA